MSEKPLHVRVAEALGCKPEEQFCPPVGGDLWWCMCPDERHRRHEWPLDLLYYNEEWSTTGPLIEKYGICLATDGDGIWGARDPLDEHSCTASTPLIAVCNLILKLAEEGKLDD
jgi:hypothetical protein